MPRKISNAPRPIEPLPVSVGSPASQSAPKPELPKEATSPAALMACHRFWRAASDCDQAIKMAYDPKIDGKHWASVREQWRVWKHDAKRRAELCKTEGLPDPLLTEVFQKLRSLDHLWRIACDYRADHKGPSTANRQDLRTPTQARNRGPRAEVPKRVEAAMTNDLQQKKIAMGGLRGMTEEALAARYHASRDTVRKVRIKVLSEFVDNSNSDK